MTTPINETNYKNSIFGLNRTFLQDVHRLNTKRSSFMIAANWVSIFLLVQLAVYTRGTPVFWYTYVPLIFLIASRIGVVINLLHEASHGFLSKSRRINDEVARWLMAYPIGVNYYGYAADHAVHHAYAATEKDVPTDIEKYYYTNFRKRDVYLHLVKDIFGITAAMIFLGYFLNERDTKKKKSREMGSSPKRTVISFAQIALVQIVFMAIFFRFDVWAYIIFWIVPCVSPHMFLMRLRGIAEHGLSRQLDLNITSPSESLYFTRSFLTPTNSYSFAPFAWLERLLICSIAINYHHEHHLFPAVPYYNLERVHRAIAKKVVAINPDAYAPGYLHAALRNLFQNQRSEIAPATAEIKSA